MLVKEHYLTLLMRPAVGSADRTGLLLKRIAKAKAAEEEVDPDELARFEEKERDIEKLLRRCSPARLALYEHNGLIFSAPIEEIGRAKVCTTVTNAQLVCRLLLENKTKKTNKIQ